jgi:ketosteroid isomerase-like protein
MNKFKLVLLTVALAVSFAACGDTADNRPANTPANAANAANTAAPDAPAPTAASLMQIEQKAHEAWKNKDSKFFEEFLTDNFVSYQRGVRRDRSAELKMIAGHDCEIEDLKVDEPRVTTVTPDVAVLTTRTSASGKCGGMDIPSQMTSSTIYVRTGGEWKAAFHGSTPIIDPKSPPPAPPKTDAKKEEAETSKPSPGPNTEALVKLHQSGWEAWKNRDAKWFNDNIISGVAIVDPLGNFHSGRDTAVKLWTETMKCEGITKVEVSDGVATSIAPNVEILTLKGTADGTCDGQKNSPLWQTAVYVKEGDAWKLAFMFESPAM